MSVSLSVIFTQLQKGLAIHFAEVQAFSNDTPLLLSVTFPPFVVYHLHPI